MTAVQKSASPKVRHRHRDIHLRVSKLAQNLHVLKMAVKAEKEGLDARFKQVRFFALHGARGKVCYIVQCLFVLQQYVHKRVGCGYAAIDCLDFEFSRTREGHLGSRPGKQARSIPTYPYLGGCQEPGKRAAVKGANGPPVEKLTDLPHDHLNPLRNRRLFPPASARGGDGGENRRARSRSSWRFFALERSR